MHACGWSSATAPDAVIVNLGTSEAVATKPADWRFGMDFRE